MSSTRINHRRSVAGNTWTRCLPVLVAGLLPLLGFCADSPTSDTNRTDLVRLQMINDMMYAADDFFGECRHLFYADQSRQPSALPAPVVVVKVTVSTSTPTYSDSKSTIPIQGGGTIITTTTVAGNGSTAGGSGSTGGSTAGGGLPPDGGGGGGDPGGGGCAT